MQPHGMKIGDSNYDSNPSKNTKRVSTPGTADSGFIYCSSRVVDVNTHCVVGSPLPRICFLRRKFSISTLKGQRPTESLTEGRDRTIYG